MLFETTLFSSPEGIELASDPKIFSSWLIQWDIIKRAETRSTPSVRNEKMRKRDGLRRVLRVVSVSPRRFASPSFRLPSWRLPSVSRLPRLQSLDRLEVKWSRLRVSLRAAMGGKDSSSARHLAR